MAKLPEVLVQEDVMLGGIKREFSVSETKDTVTLQPTDIAHINGRRFRIVDRKAEVGERAIYYFEGKSDGIIFDVLASGATMIDVEYEDELGESVCGIDHGAYRVLVPVESETSTDKPKSTDDIIANLVKRVAEMERELVEYRALGLRDHLLIGNTTIDNEITGIKRDIETWAQEVEELKFKVRIIDDLQDVNIDRLNDADDKIEMCIDDIVTLDERLQPKEITISIDDLAKLIGGVRG